MRLLAVLLIACPLFAAEWPYWRGVNGDGVSPDTGLPEEWSPEGENLIWKAPVGGRSTPIVLGGNVCVIRLSEPETPAKWQEQVVCLDEETGEVLWEHRLNVFQTDIPHHRVGWASLVGDPESGNVYSHSISGVANGYTGDDKLLWSRSLDEQTGRFSGFGGRTVTPILDGDLLIVSFLTAGFGPNFIPRHRFYALDKNTGETVWLSTPGEAPYDTTYSAPVVRVIDGQRQLIAGNGDGSIHGLQVQTGKLIWRFPLSERGINSSVVVEDGVVYASHSEENVDGSTSMGRLVALDAKQITDGKPKELWRVDGFQAGYASPAIYEGILYHVDNSANLVAFDAQNGERLWQENVGIAQRASPVIGDGKLYVSDVDGQFHIFKLNGRNPPEKLDTDAFENPDGSATQINGSPAIANGRVYLPTNNDLYCIGTGNGESNPPNPVLGPPEEAPADAEPAVVQVVPAETNLYAGKDESVQFKARTFDANGRLIGEAEEVEWSLEGIDSEVTADGALMAPEENSPQAGQVVAKVDDLEGVSQVAVRASIPFEEDFSGYEVDSVPGGWPGARGRFSVVEKDGEKVLFKSSANQRSWRTTVYIGDPDARDYEMQVDVFFTEQARRLPDAGLISHRYTFDLMGNRQTLMIRTWMSEFERFQAEKQFQVDPDIWYRLKFRVEPGEEEGQPTKLYGKVWPRDEQEPEEWTIEAEDPLGHAYGSPGLYGYAAADIYYDNLSARSVSE